VETTTLALVAALSSAFGGLIGVLGTLWISRRRIQTDVALAERRIHAEVVLAERMKWLDKLRTAIAEFQSALSRFYLMDESGRKIDVIERQETIGAADLAMRKILLLLNPSEHQALESVVTEAFAKAGTTSFETVTDVARPILKREWERVKRGE
jgi:hypothetical protein